MPIQSKAFWTSGTCWYCGKKSKTYGRGAKKHSAGATRLRVGPNWQTVKPSSFDEVIDGSKLASIVDEVSRDPETEKRTHRVSRLEKMLKHDVSAINWLDQLIGYLRKNGLGDSLREYQIVPSQARFLRVLPNLHRDVGISPELKSVAELLDWRIKTELRDCGIDTLAENPGAGDWDNEYVVEQLLGKLSERADNTPDDKFSQASINLFFWLVEQERWNDLRGFPVFARRVASEHPIDIVRLPDN